eukprot:477929_1
MCAFEYVLIDVVLYVIIGAVTHGTLSRLQQFRAQDLILIECCHVLKCLWDTHRSVMTFYHDGTTQKGQEQESILFSFDIEDFDECERSDDVQYTPDTTDGIIFRGIWHQNVPVTTAEGIIEWAVTPAIENLDKIGYGLYYNKWIPMKDRVKDKVGMMTDGNSTAQKTSHLIGKKLESTKVYKKKK